MYLSQITEIPDAIFTDWQINEILHVFSSQKISKHLWYDTKVFHYNNIFTARFDPPLRVDIVPPYVHHMFYQAVHKRINK
jgi:hypothetical protein